MTNRAGLTLLIIGTILLFAVHLHLGFISLQIAGVILVVTAVLGWGLPRYRPGWTTRQRARLGEWLDPDPEVAGSSRVPLTDILAAQAAAPAAAPVAAPQPPPADVTDPDLVASGDAIPDPPVPPDPPAQQAAPVPQAPPPTSSPPAPPVPPAAPATSSPPDPPAAEPAPTWPAADDPPTQPDIPAIPGSAAAAGQDGPDHDHAGRHAAGRHAAGQHAAQHAAGQRAAQAARRLSGAGLRT